jgi:hypothetical protein
MSFSGYNLYHAFNTQRVNFDPKWVLELEMVEDLIS